MSEYITTEKLDGLPKKVLDQLSKTRNMSKQKLQLLELMGKDSCDLDYMIIQFWRKHRFLMERNVLRGVVSDLARKKLITRTASGVYKVK